jgi:hypothetical protein
MSLGAEVADAVAANLSGRPSPPQFYQETAHGQPHFGEVSFGVAPLCGTHFCHEAWTWTTFLEEDLEVVGQVIQLVGSQRSPQLFHKARGTAGIGADQCKQVVEVLGVRGAVQTKRSLLMSDN